MGVGSFFFFFFLELYNWWQAGIQDPDSCVELQLSKIGTHVPQVFPFLCHCVFLVQDPKELPRTSEDFEATVICLSFETNLDSHSDSTLYPCYWDPAPCVLGVVWHGCDTYWMSFVCCNGETIVVLGCKLCFRKTFGGVANLTDLFGVCVLTYYE